MSSAMTVHAEAIAHWVVARTSRDEEAAIRACGKRPRGERGPFS
jgi:hypothetical protein